MLILFYLNAVHTYYKINKIKNIKFFYLLIFYTDIVNLSQSNGANKLFFIIIIIKENRTSQFC